jgi:hypothetical protein
MTESNGERYRAKKREEREYLDLLIDLYPGFPAGRVIHSESPDFIVQSTRKQKTGIELTRLTRTEGDHFEGSGHFHPDFSLDSLQELLNCKESKIGLYKTKGVEKIWLVILVNGFSQSPAFNINNQLERWRPETTFDALLILDLSLQRIYEVKSPSS